MNRIVIALVLLVAAYIAFRYYNMKKTDAPPKEIAKPQAPVESEVPTAPIDGDGDKDD